MHFKLIFKDLINYNSIKTRLNEIHSTLTLAFGNFYEEYPEQLMVCRYLNGNENVLEIGGNIGRNSLVIGRILNYSNNNNFVVLESDNEIAQQLIHNRDINNLNFNVEPFALSKRNLIQREWETIESDQVLDGYKKVNTITLEELNNKYNISFDTIVLDCEGAFYYILMDMPEILDNVKTIIMENDYHEYDKKAYVDSILTEKSFTVVYEESGGWGPCFNNFFQVWKKVN
jgi:FkbM family methyltransferase